MQNPVENSVFKFIASIFRKYKIPCVLVDGYALIANKVQRMTFDIDLIISEKEFNKIERDVLQAGYEIFNKQKAFVQFRSKRGGYRDIDFLISDDKTIDILCKDGGEARFAGDKFIVPSPKHLIDMKLHSITNNKARKSKDFSDILQLVRLNDIDPKTSEMKILFEKYSALGQDLYTELLDEF